ncbi:hypothetical protein PIB30_046020 [Stylosanthes scabra]|uniref:Uncharacterized protein n=1 Tax=Stylosanthes scabra TaxID=79078 RepID=A0ABU6XED9_9FABA|nr:hypothetical protein [Stylosanthes scabra]
MSLLVYFRPLGIEKGIGKTKEGIGSKGFMKRSQEEENRTPSTARIPRASAQVPGSITDSPLPHSCTCTIISNRSERARQIFGAVAGELKNIPDHADTFIIQNWESCQVDCHSDSGSDGYYSCEDSLPACQIDRAEFQHQNHFNELFRALMQEKAEIKEAQKKIEARLLTVTKLAGHVIDRFANPQLARHEEGLSAVTLRLGTQLKGPTIRCPDNVPTTPAGVDL